MLQLLSHQGVERVIATPHFLANKENVTDFLSRRRASFETLKPSLTKDMPEILLGAEVKYYQGISRLENLRQLCIQSSNLLLLEMSPVKWTEYTIKEIVDISSSGINVVLAHVERYSSFQSSKTLEQLMNCDILMQVNADSFNDWLTRRKTLKLLVNNRAGLIGSDCHNLTTRSPRIGEAFEVIEKKLGKGFVNQINEYGKSLFYVN